MEVYLIRHGKTAGNLEKRYVGRTDEPLTREGGMELKRNRLCYPVPECLFASPLKRCRETAALLYPGAEAELCEDLRECDFGRFEYRNYGELDGDQDYQAWIDSNGTLPFPGGESSEGFRERSCRGFLKCMKRAAAQGASSAAFVVHGGTVMAVMERFCQERKSYFGWQVGNGCGFHLRLEGEPLLRLAQGGEEVQGGFALIEELPLPEGRVPRTGIEEVYVMQQNRRLQCGYTTGTCAAAAARAAAVLLLGGEVCRQAELTTPSGVPLSLEVQFPKRGAEFASCAVRKYAGDDPDATDGLLIFAEVRRLPPEEGGGPGSNEIRIEGGPGVGRVTRPGLEQPVGAAAINRVPRQMIRAGLRAVCRDYGYGGGLSVVISVPGGAETAEKTFNPRLGIEGGISILGTSGIVVPMSEQALIESIRVEMRQRVRNGERYLLVTPGNYGADFLKSQEQYQMLCPAFSMKCSNYVGETLDMAAELGVRGILFVAHLGKFIKVSGGIMNTHSAQGDCRAELIAAQAMRAGADEGTARRLLDTNTTEEAVGILREAGCLSRTMEVTAKRIRTHLQKRCMGALQTEAILFSSQLGYLGETEGAEELMGRLAEEKGRLAQEPAAGKQEEGGRG